MRAILEFQLPEDAEAHKWAVEAASMVATITDVDNHCRNALKHGHNYKTADEALESIREHLRESINMIYEIH